MRLPNSLTWVHLSDLHFGQGGEATTRFDQKVVTADIIRDVELVAGELGPPDFVFLTGDVAFSASADKEYAVAAEWLRKLLGALKVGPDRVLVVPGNHDVDRKKAVEGQGDLAHEGLRAKPEKVNELLENTAKMEAIWPKLTAYQRFASTYGSPEISAASPFWTKLLSTDLGPVVAIGLNTALLSFDKTDGPETLALGSGQIHRALVSVPDDALVIVLQHHPPEWLRDGKDLLVSLNRKPHLLFSGHVHEPGGFVRTPIASHGGVELVAGAGHQDASEAGEHAYAWGRLHRDGLDYFPRAWLKRARSFHPQPINPPKDQKSYSPALGEFARLPRTKLPEALHDWLDANTTTGPASRPHDPMTKPVLLGGSTLEISPATASSTGTVATYDPANAYFSVPYRPKGDQVIGQTETLQKVHGQLEKGRPTAIGQTAAFVGLGGLGKTQLAIEYAWLFRDRYSGGVYWFNADEDLDRQLTTLAVAARWVSPASEPRIQLEIAIRQIRNRSDCLIVFDNVEDPNVIAHLMPEASATPHLLITSRVPHAGFDPVPMDRLSDGQSVDLLRSESGRLDGPADSEAALRIARQLEGLPLALELAGAYLRRFREVSWASYADLLESEGVKARGLCDGPLASFTRHNANLYATLQIDEKVFKSSPRLRELIDLLAWSGSASMGKELMTALLGIPDSALDVALGEAETLRILKREQGPTEQSKPRFHMHRLVRDVRRIDVPLELEPNRWLGVVERLGSWFKERSADFSELLAYEDELDHLEVWQEHARIMGRPREAALLCALRASPPYHRGKYLRAQELAQQALLTFQYAAVMDPMLEAQIRNDLGTILGELGEHQKALAYHQEFLDILRETLGESHPDIAAAFNNVGGSLQDLGEHPKALEYQRKALAISCEVFGNNHSMTATCFNNVGTTLGKLGEYRKALEHEQKALDILRETFGENHPNTAATFDNIGGTLANLGERQNALEYKQKALAIRLEILGEKHPDTATSFNNIGIVLAKLGEYRGALEYMRKALAIRLEVLGEKHPDTAKTWGSIVTFLLERHDKNMAFKLIEDALKKFPRNAKLRQLKSVILGKGALQNPRVSSGRSKKLKPPKR